MTVSIQIRNVPAETRDALSRAAKRRGMSMQAYLLELLNKEAGFARNPVLLAQARDISDKAGVSISDDAVIAAIRELRDEPWIAKNPDQPVETLRQPASTPATQEAVA